MSFNVRNKAGNLSTTLAEILGLVLSNPNVPMGFFCSDVTGDEPTCDDGEDLVCCLQVVSVSSMISSA